MCDMDPVILLSRMFSGASQLLALVRVAASRLISERIYSRQMQRWLPGAESDLDGIEQKADEGCLHVHIAEDGRRWVRLHVEHVSGGHADDDRPAECVHSGVVGGAAVDVGEGVTVVYEAVVNARAALRTRADVDVVDAGHLAHEPVVLEGCALVDEYLVVGDRLEGERAGGRRRPVLCAVSGPGDARRAARRVPRAVQEAAEGDLVRLAAQTAVDEVDADLTAAVTL